MLGETYSQKGNRWAEEDNLFADIDYQEAIIRMLDHE